MSIDAWNSALLDVLLPTQQQPSAPVLLACDDEALRLAGERLGLAKEDPARRFVADLSAAYGISTERGLTGALVEAQRWRDGPRPRRTPPFLAALCASVLAASRMDRDERAPTHAYYLRLGDLLGIALLDGWPPVAAFDGFIALFDDLADWLCSDLDGARGHLALPPRTPHWVIDRPIGQTPLRGRDRRLLGAFFDRYERSLNAGFDPLRLLRSWGGIEGLTNPARRAIDNPDIAPQVRSALRAAFAAWDGTLIDQDGRRLLPVRLRLGANLRAVTVNVTCPALDQPMAATGPDGPLTIPPDGQELTLPAAWLDLAASGPVNLDLADGTRIGALPGPIMLFEVIDSGMYRVPAAQTELVWLLTCDEELLARDWPVTRIHAAPLPAGWRLIVDVTPDELPDELRAPEADEPQQHDNAALLGGLPLGDGAFLLRHPPALVHELPEPVALEIDGRYAGEIEPGRLRYLNEIAQQPGTHGLSVGDTAELVFELAARGRQEAIGSLRHYLAGPAGLAAGATDTAPAGAVDGATVSGALISNDGEHRLAAPVMIRANSTVEVIYTDGRVESVPPPIPPGWQAAVGIQASERWPIPDSEKAAFVCVPSRQHRRVIVLRATQAPDTDAALLLAEDFASANVIDRTPDGTGACAWARLVDMAAETFIDEPKASGV